MTAAELDGRPVLISGRYHDVQVWDLATGAPVGDPFTGHTEDVRAVAVAELDGRPVVISGAGDGVRVWDLATGAPVGRPFTGHARWVQVVAAAELDGRPVVISCGDRTVRVWDLARRQAMRHNSHRVRLRHAAPVRAAVLVQRKDHVHVITGCTDGTSQTWDLSTGNLLSTIITPGRSGVSAISALAPDHLLYANGRTISLYKATNATNPILVIELHSEIQALTAHGTTTVVAATRLGLIALRVPH